MVVALSLAAIVAGYSGSRLLAWQMFPEASRWQADVYRVTADGDRVDIRDPWPGGYRWSELVNASGLATPWSESHASYGVEATVEALEDALDWVAAHTPDDRETVRLEAVVRFRHNAEAWQVVTIRSIARDTS